MKDGLSPEKVYRVLDLISQRPQVSQRELAQYTGFSLGLVNLTVKRLIKTGHIKARALNRRKLQYLLTPKGIVEKSNRTTNYISRTLETFSEYKRRVDDLLSGLVSEGHTSFALLGKGEVSSLVELFFHRNGDAYNVRTIEEGDALRDGEIVLDCRLAKNTNSVGISVLERLLQVGPPQY